MTFVSRTGGGGSQLSHTALTCIQTEYGGFERGCLLVFSVCI